jgi:hypothetical protein
MNPLHHIQKIFYLVFIVGLSSCSYLPENDPATADLVYEETADYILLKSAASDNSKAGIIFYPGGLVDPHAYVTSFENLVREDQRTVVILKVTSNLAIWNSQKASKVIDKLKQIDQWVVGGHSLGGSTACIDVFNNPNSFAGLFLLAAYSVNDLSAVDIPVISITGSEDQVLDPANFEDNKVNLPPELHITAANELSDNGSIGSTIYYTIQGGNHGQFGSYGQQDGDGIATITSDTQHDLVTKMLQAFLQTNNL